MKIIDLLNKIANGEEVPKKIKVFDGEYEFDTYNNTYRNKEMLGTLGQNYSLDGVLNDEVEIIEEPKKIEYPILHKTAPSETTGDQMPNWRYLIDCNFEHLNKTIYQLIDKVNKLDKEK